MTEINPTSSAQLISVIMPFLNGEQFIEEAIDSVFRQTYSNWELMLVDDGSTDASTQIAQRFAQANSERVRYLTHVGHRNLGASAARNLGIRNARGNYIAFLDSDDVWFPDKLARQVAVLDAYPRAGMIIGASHYWYGWTGQSEDAGHDVVKPVGAPQDVLIDPPALSILLYPLGRGAAPSMNSLLVRTEVIKQASWEEEFDYFYEDQVFLAKLYLHTPIYIESACSDRYRQHAGSSMAKAARMGDYHPTRRRFLEWLEAYLAAEAFDDPRVLELLHGALLPYRHPIRWHVAELRRHPLGQMKRLVKGLRRRALGASG